MGIILYAMGCLGILAGFFAPFAGTYQWSNHDDWMILGFFAVGALCRIAGKMKDHTNW